jgi:hypothetical protein
MAEAKGFLALETAIFRECLSFHKISSLFIKVYMYTVHIQKAGKSIQEKVKKLPTVNDPRELC